MPKLTAQQFIKKLESHKSPEEVVKQQRYFKTGKGEYGEGDIFIGIRMGVIFNLAKESLAMELSEVEKLLLSPIHEVRVGALSIMNQIARKKKTPENIRKQLFDLYLKRHNRINNWDLVDVSCIYVVGGYLFDKPRDVLYKLAKSKSLWERRTSIVSTAYFIKQKDLADTFKISEMLLGDKEDLIHKASGWMLRYAGLMDRNQLVKFLDKHAKVMPRTMLRYSLEHFEKKDREYYMGLRKAS